VRGNSTIDENWKEGLNSYDEKQTKQEEKKESKRTFAYPHLPQHHTWQSVYPPYRMQVLYDGLFQFRRTVQILRAIEDFQFLPLGPAIYNCEFSENEIK
jgi:hypothetical protein